MRLTEEDLYQAFPSRLRQKVTSTLLTRTMKDNAYRNWTPRAEFEIAV